MNLFSLSLRLSGFKIAAAKRELVRLNALPPVEYHELSDNKKWEIVKFHSENNAFYRKLLGGSLPKNWEDLPILTKNDLQQPLTERLSRHDTPKNVYLGETSGSAGHPFTFAKDRWCHALSWASFSLHYAARGINLDQDLQARFYGIPYKGTARYKERFKDVLSSRYRFPIFELNENKMDIFLKLFRTKPFIYINGYTSSILLFAKYLQAKNILLTDICPSLKACITTSEMLFDTDRSLMQNALGVPVINEYGASETGLIGFEGEKKELIVDQNLLYMEIVDDDGKILPYGEKGRVVITALYNRANPFIRYDIGDLASITPSKNGRDLVIQELGGRANDVALLPSGKSVPGLAFYYMTKSVLEKSGNVRELMITQNSLDTFTVAYLSRREFSSAEVKKLHAAVAAYLEPGLNLNLKRSDFLERGSNGKLKQFRSLL